MEIAQIVGLALVTTIMLIILRQEKPVMALILFFLATILKILGVAYLGEFAAAICQDAGEQAVARKVEFAAKIIIAVLALPIMIAILESLMQLMPG